MSAFLTRSSSSADGVSLTRMVAGREHAVFVSGLKVMIGAFFQSFFSALLNKY
jgi:hypothetical protein